MLYLFLYFAALFGWLIWRRAAPFSFPVMTTGIWLFALLVSSLGLVVYPNPISWQTVAFIIGCHSFMMAGYYLARPKSGTPTALFAPTAYSEILFVCALLFVSLQFASTLLDGQIPIIGTAGNVAEARTQHWEGGEVSLMKQVAKAFVYPAIAFVILLPWLWQKRLFAKVTVAAFGFAALADHGFAEGGRSVLVVAAIGTTVTYFLCYRVQLNRKVIIAVVVTLLAYQLTTNFYLARNPNFRTAPSFFIEYNCARGKMSERVRSADLEWKALVLSSCYASAPLRLLDDFIRRDWRHTFGIYNGGIIFNDAFEKERERLSVFYRGQGIGQNPWATSMRDFWIDFNYWAILAYLPLGFGFGFWTRRRKFLNEGDIIRYSMVANAAFLIPFISPLNIRYIIFPIVVTMLLPVASSLIPTARLSRNITKVSRR